MQIRCVTFKDLLIRPFSANRTSCKGYIEQMFETTLYNPIQLTYHVTEGKDQYYFFQLGSLFTAIDFSQNITRLGKNSPFLGEMAFSSRTFFSSPAQSAILR